MTTTPTVIYTISDLQAIQSDLSGYYVLGADIDAAGYNFTPIGRASNPFTGILDGQGHTISNLTINLSADEVGLFGDIGTTGVVQNLGLINLSVTGSASPTTLGQLIGGVAGSNAGTIARSYTTGTITGDRPSLNGFISVGGLVGINYGTVTQSYSAATVTGASDASIVRVGGLVGENDYGTITQSYATGPATGTSAKLEIGGLVGSDGAPESGATTSSYWDVETTGQQNSAGGTGLTTVQLQSGTLPDGFDSTIWFDNAGQFPALLWQVTGNHPPEIDAAHSTPSTGTINELPNVSGSGTVDYANGANAINPSGVVAFTDLDTTDRPTASIDTAHQTVTYQSSDGSILSLTPTQIAAFKSAFSIAPETGNTNTGKVDWTYSIADNALDFLWDKDQVTVTTPIVIDDHNGHPVTQNVTVTINGEGPDPSHNIAIVQRNSPVAASAARGLLANDSDRDTLHVTSVGFSSGNRVTVPENGSVSIKGNYGILTIYSDGHYQYNANNKAPANSIVHDVFTYTVGDGNHSDLKASFLNVSVVNKLQPYSAVVELEVHFDGGV
jgi:Bacterial cadherin-like domain/The GLUG motif